VIEVKFIRGFAEATLAAIALPHLDLHYSRNDSPSLGVQMHWLGQVLITLNGD
jgi:hypothetical protein